MSKLRRRLSRVRVSWSTVLWLTALWVLLWADVSVGNAIAGIGIGWLVTALLPLPSIGYRGTVRPLQVFSLVGHFGYDLVRASFQVAFLALNPRHVPRGAVVGVQLRNESDLYLAFTAELSTLVPGSVVVEALRRNGMVYVHVLDLDLMGGVQRVRAEILGVEERVMRALASDEELERAGFDVPNRRQR